MRYLKAICLFLLVFVCAQAKSQTDTLIATGTYKGKNLYMQNPMKEKGRGFCVQKVMINKKEEKINVESSAFEIPFDSTKYHIGDPVEVMVIHAEGCRPKLLEINVERKALFEPEYMTLDSIGRLTFKTKTETEKLTFAIEQFRWNKWVKVGEVPGQGKSGSIYNYRLKLHSGLNRIRIRQVDYFGKSKPSATVDVKSNSPEILFMSPATVSTVIELSEESLYEIYDEYGNVIRQEMGKDIDISRLKKGTYYLNYDNTTKRFGKK
ncbi:MAG TPA: hypothetical protein VK177_18020 [Flavobacteriales bacterium]|nr:hypothetical protein [Flavobacteriales bacterium]